MVRQIAERDFLNIAKQAAINAGKAVLSLRGKKLITKRKERVGDFATEADELSEKIILDLLQKRYPEHNFISEEVGERDNSSEYTWFIDPLDGTIPFSSGLPHFGISIGLLKENQPYLGVVNIPALGHLLWAERGGGAFLDGGGLRVSSKTELLKSVVGFDLAYIGMRAKELRRLVEPLADKVRYPPNLGCACVGASYVAMRVYDAYLHSAHPWDYAASAIIIEEAGGKVTDFNGRRIDWTADWVDFFASNGKLHYQILDLIKK